MIFSTFFISPFVTFSETNFTILPAKPKSPVLKKAENIITVPESTIEFSGDSAFVQLVKKEKPEQVFEKHLVKVGLSDGIKIEIKEGLTVKDKVRGAAIDPKK